MAGLRKGVCYRRIKRAYTRKSKYKSKKYLTTSPILKISRYDMGNLSKKFKFKVFLITKDTLQIRNNAIEAARQMINRKLEITLGNNYHLKINLYPHHALRENKMLGGAHADRLQTGMAHSFGRTTGLAVQAKKGKVLFSVRVLNNGAETARKALKLATPRLPGTYSIQVKKLN